METRNLDKAILNTMSIANCPSAENHLKIWRDIKGFRTRIVAIADEITVKEIGTFTEQLADDLKSLELDTNTIINLLTATVADLVVAALNKSKNAMKKHLAKKRNGLVHNEKTVAKAHAQARPEVSQTSENLALIDTLTSIFSRMISSHVTNNTEFNASNIKKAHDIPKDLAHKLRFHGFLEAAGNNVQKAEELMDNPENRDAACAALKKHFPNLSHKSAKSFFAHVTNTFRRPEWEKYRE